MKGDLKREVRLLAQYGQLVWTFLTALLIWQLDSRWWKIGWALWTAVIGTTTFAFFIKCLSGPTALTAKTPVNSRALPSATKTTAKVSHRATVPRPSPILSSWPPPTRMPRRPSGPWTILLYSATSWTPTGPAMCLPVSRWDISADSLPLMRLCALVFVMWDYVDLADHLRDGIHIAEHALRLEQAVHGLDARDEIVARDAPCRFFKTVLRSRPGSPLPLDRRPQTDQPPAL